MYKYAFSIGGCCSFPAESRSILYSEKETRARTSLLLLLLLSSTHRILSVLYYRIEKHTYLYFMYSPRKKKILQAVRGTNNNIICVSLSFQRPIYIYIYIHAVLSR